MADQEKELTTEDKIHGNVQTIGIMSFFILVIVFIILINVVKIK